jgi:hypothetical protein
LILRSRFIEINEPLGRMKQQGRKELEMLDIAPKQAILQSSSRCTFENCDLVLEFPELDGRDH